MTDRVFNFAAGPATLPLPVLEQAQRDLVSLPGIGASPLEVSHRSPWFEDVIGEAEANLRSLLAIPESYHVVFCQGGASMQFSMVPMNLLRGSVRPAAYVVTGSWGMKALKEAEKEGSARVVWSGNDEGFVRVPHDDELRAVLDDEVAYVHITSNETIHGVEFPTTPIVPPAAPLISDSSSDFLSRPVDISSYALLYAGAQKNAGPAGVTIAIVRDDLLARIPDRLPTVMDYRTYVEHRSMYNTPPVFAIYVLMLVTRWLRDEVGGLKEQLERNREKASAIYDAIDGSEGFYRGHAAPRSRSLMNVTWRLPSEDLERRFIKEAATLALVELKGHRSVGGIRASLYNAMPLAGARALADFMRTFAGTHRAAT
ncbi:MAG: 3-phosphoserine/phosphohydroxythreonine transaminase [Actinomycetota bacterium]